MVQVQDYGSTAVVSVTDLRRETGTVIDEVLPEYELVQIERKGTVIATLTEPQETEDGPTTRTFGEDEDEDEPQEQATL